MRVLVLFGIGMLERAVIVRLSHLVAPNLVEDQLLIFLFGQEEYLGLEGVDVLLIVNWSATFPRVHHIDLPVRYRGVTFANPAYKTTLYTLNVSCVGQGFFLRCSPYEHSSTQHINTSQSTVYCECIFRIPMCSHHNTAWCTITPLPPPLPTAPTERGGNTARLSPLPIPTSLAPYLDFLFCLLFQAVHPPSSLSPATMLSLLFTAYALSDGEAGCAVTARSCFYRRGGVDFGNEVFTLTDEAEVELPQGDALSSLCSARNWAQHDSCRVDCPFALEVSGPGGFSTRLCLDGSLLDPFVQSSHLHEAHALRNKEVEFVLVGNPADPLSAQACSPADWMATGQSVAGKVVFMLRGSCVYPQKFAIGKMFGIAAAIVMNIAPDAALMKQMSEAVGMSHGSEGIPVGMISKHTGVVVYSMLAQGVPLKAKFTLNCPTFGTIPEASQPFAGDGCPHPSLIDKCNHMPNPEDRLCSKCRMKLTHPQHPSLQVCLWASSLLPRSDANLLWTNMPPPLSALPATYVVGGTTMGCTPSDFAGLAGKMLFIMFPPTCLPLEVLLNAQGAGVHGVLFLTNQGKAVPQTIEGMSQFVKIAAHTIEPRHWSVIDSIFRSYGTPVAATAPGVTAFDLTLSAEEGVQSDRVPEVTAAPPLISVEEDVEEVEEGLQYTAAVVVPFLVAMALLVACVWTIYRQKRDAVDLPTEGRKGGIQIPLGAASMGLSLSLMLMVSVVAFTLTFIAGEDAKNTAVEDGEEASSQNYRNAVDNVKLISTQMRLNVLGQVQHGLEKILDEGQNVASSVSALYFDANLTFDSLLSKYNNLVVMMKRAPRWRSTVITTNGFHFAWGTRKHVQDTTVDRNDGFKHGTSMTFYDPQQGINYRIFDFPTSVNRIMYHNRVGTEFGDPFAFTNELPNQSYRWHLTRKTAIQESDITSIYVHPLTVYTPIFNLQKERLGLVQSDLRLSSIAEIVTNALSSASLENATAVVFEADTNNVVSTNVFSQSFPYLSYFIGSSVRAYQLYRMDEIPAVQLVALSHALQGTQHHELSATIDQSEYYSTPHHGNSLMDLVITSTAMDISQLRFKTEMRGACMETGSCFADGAMNFYGDNMLNIYKNLTLDSPVVEATRVSPDGASFQSSVVLYNASMPLPGLSGATPAERCVYFPKLVASFPEQCSVKRPFVEASYTLHVKFRADADVQPLDKTQVLYSSSWAGNSLLRLYASGFMTVEVMSYGCRTQIPPSAISGGVWHTLTATTDRMAMTCSVYLDGKHVSTGRLGNPEGKSMYTAISTTDPHVVGMHFKGKISRVKFWEMALLAEEVAGLEEKGELQRYVPKRKWLADVRRFVRNSTTSAVLDWRVGVMIPQDDVMRDIDNNNIATRRLLTARTKNLNHNLKQKSYETVLIVVVLVLASVLVFLLFNDLLTKPFARVAVVMAEAAVMRIDEVPDLSSHLLEMNTIHRAMVLMMKNLKEYRSYMPQSVLADTSDAEEHLPRTDTDLSMSRSSLASGLRNEESSSTHFTREAAAKRGTMALSLVKRRVSFVLVNICGWHMQVKERGEARTIETHTRVLHAVLGHFAAAKGVSEVFSGDRFLCGFNGVKPHPSHRMGAACAALSVRAYFEGESVQTSCAVVSGDARVGNMGCDEMKRYSYITSLLGWVNALERYACSLGVHILCDSWIAQDAVSELSLRTVGTVSYAKRAEQPLVVHEVAGKKCGAREDEWMYQMEAAERADPYYGWNKFADAVLKGDFEVWNWGI